MGARALRQGHWRASRFRALDAFGRCLLVLGALSIVGGADMAAQSQDDNPHGKIEILCSTCHSPDSWKPARIAKAFDHGQYGMPLDGGHGSVTCASCHQSLEFTKVGTTCVSCHQDTHRGELGLDCAQCHSTRSFNDRAQQINHAMTRFPLDGAHRTVDCRSCHTPGPGGALVFRGAPTTCIACHRGAFDRTAAPSHVAAAFSSDCTSCHNKATWRGASYDHSLSDFALTGAHRAITCQACHADRVFTGKSKACVSCHQVNFEQTKTPPHLAAHFDQNCLSCHTTTDWSGAGYDHGVTKFPLTGAHRALACATCHADGTYVGRPTTCISCHQAGFDQTAKPPHRAAGFSTDCATCHTTVTWPGATFNHNTTSFPLAGAHKAAICGSCHINNVYKGTPTTCVSCHVTDFNATVNPNHKTAGFPTDCLSCHTTARWLGATFAHDAQYFRIYSGKHQAQWATCATCHTNSANYKEFTCLTCHEHSKTSMDNTHQGRSGYSYTSPACLSCHPRV